MSGLYLSQKGYWQNETKKDLDLVFEQIIHSEEDEALPFEKRASIRRVAEEKEFFREMIGLSATVCIYKIVLSNEKKTKIDLVHFDVEQAFAFGSYLKDFAGFAIKNVDFSNEYALTEVAPQSTVGVVAYSSSSCRDSPFSSTPVKIYYSQGLASINMKYSSEGVITLGWFGIYIAGMLIVVMMAVGFANGQQSIRKPDEGGSVPSEEAERSDV